jgi:cell division protein FtsB
MSLRNSALTERARSIALRAAGAAWAALAVYCALSIVAGPAGLLSYRRLEGRKAEMQRNLGALGEANARLRAELDSLRSDADRAAREARSLGYLRPGEKAIIVSGRVPESLELVSGEVLPYTPSPAWPDSALKQIALGAFLAILAAGLAPKKTR